MGFTTLGSVSPDAGFFAFDHSQPILATQLARSVKTAPIDPPRIERILLIKITLLIYLGLIFGCRIVGSRHNRRAAVVRLLSETAPRALVRRRSPTQLIGSTTPRARDNPVLESDGRASFSRQVRATVIAHYRWITLQAPDGRHIVNSRVPGGQPLPFSSFSSEPPQNVRADPDQIT